MTCINWNELQTSELVDATESAQGQSKTYVLEWGCHLQDIWTQCRLHMRMQWGREACCATVNGGIKSCLVPDCSH